MIERPIFKNKDRPTAPEQYRLREYIGFTVFFHFFEISTYPEFFTLFPEKDTVLISGWGNRDKMGEKASDFGVMGGEVREILGIFFPEA